MKKLYSESFNHYVNQHAIFNEDHFSSLLSLFHVYKYNAGDHIIELENEKSIVFFIFSGLIRCYYLAEDGKEWSRGFVQEEVMCTTIPKEYLQRFSPYGIHSMEDSIILIADFMSLKCCMIKFQW